VLGATDATIFAELIISLASAPPCHPGLEPSPELHVHLPRKALATRKIVKQMSRLLKVSSKPSLDFQQLLKKRLLAINKNNNKQQLL
jgi:hypothetical protein